MSRLAAIALLLIGCTRSLPPVTRPVEPQSPESRQVEAVIVAWNERQDLPPLPADRLRAVQVTDPPDVESFARICPAHAGACHSYRRRIVIIRPGMEAGRRLSLIRHEIVHMAAGYSGMGSGSHIDVKLFAYECADATCRAAAVEERARTIATSGYQR